MKSNAELKGIPLSPSIKSHSFNRIPAICASAKRGVLLNICQVIKNRKEPTHRKKGKMSDDVSLRRQRACLGEGCDDCYVMDMYSLVQPGQHSNSELRKQLFLYLTKDGGRERKRFLQEEQTRLGLIKAYTDRLCLKEKGAKTIIAHLKMGDFQAVKKLERTKIDEFKLPEKLSFTLPLGNATSLKIAALLTNEQNKSLLETEHFEVKLPVTHLEETKPAVEHDHTSQ
ncbi:uncharacterized protein LOC111325807 isoform X1 [Stylophora pistillata]|uniref:uncharacterized protein LOC111325807 isoform X1 n=1 Tax=Stylophora pistillata TaxID=50429 RepID=UPI000C03B50F|nr:uncharacterized protein LOC111325807 isoform X1 [Stylophora pistillata]